MKKNVFIPWTGGLDSTYLIYKNLSEGNTVYSSSILFANNVNQTIYEMKARYHLLPILEKIAEENNCNFYYESSYNIKFFAGGSGYVLGQLPVLINSFRYLCPYGWVDEVQFAYVKGDDFFDSDFNMEKLFRDNFTNLEIYNVESKNVKLSFPLKYVSKSEILEIIDKRLLDLVHWCETPEIDVELKDLLTLILTDNVSDEFLNDLPKLNYCECHSCERMLKLKEKELWIEK